MVYKQTTYLKWQLQYPTCVSYKRRACKYISHHLQAIIINGFAFVRTTVAHLVEPRKENNGLKKEIQSDWLSTRTGNIQIVQDHNFNLPSPIPQAFYELLLLSNKLYNLLNMASQGLQL